MVEHPATIKFRAAASANEPRGPFAARLGSWQAVLGLVLSLALARIIYLVWLCPYSLIEDEAHYWEWSRRLDWSYYSKGPGIAWSIAASTGLFGDSEWAVRLPVVIASAITMLALAGLANDVFRDLRVAFFTAACAALVPMYQVTSLLATIDMPYAACWSVAAWAAWRAFKRESLSAWIMLGLALGVGFLFKYTILLLIPGLVLFAFVSRRTLNLARRWPFLALVSIALTIVGTLPVLVWNARHGWPTLHHLLGHLGVAGGDVAVTQGEGKGWHYNPVWTLEFIGTQLGIVGPALALAFWAYRRSRGNKPRATLDTETHNPEQPAERANGALFLWLCAAPVIVFYLAVTLVAEAEGNWAMAGYTTILCLAGAGVVEGMDEFLARVAAWRTLPEPRPRQGLLRRKPETFPQLAWLWTLIFGLVAGLGMLRVDLAALVPGIGPYVPVGRLVGAPIQAQDAFSHAAALRRRTGLEPFYVTQHYGVAGRLAFYLPNHPTVYCSSSRMGGRKTQYDFWLDTDLDDLETLGGRPAVMVGAEIETWQLLFDRVESFGKLEGDHKKGRPAFGGVGYRGFPNRARPNLNASATQAQPPK